MNKKLANIIESSIIAIFTLLGAGSCSAPNKVEDDLTIYEYPTSLLGFGNNKKTYITNAGQSGDMYEFIYYMDQLQYEYSVDPFLSCNDIEDNSLVFINVGCSLKSLAEYQITIQSEINRINEYVSYASKHNIDLIGVHLGGKARRGESSDALISALFSSSSLNIFKMNGNYDGFLASFSSNNVNYTYASELKEIIRKIYGVN